MESQTSPGISEEVSKRNQEMDEKKMVSRYDLSHPKTELGDTRMDKLFSNREHEEHIGQNRWMDTNPHANHHLEAMEGANKANVGITETGSTGMDGKTKCRIRRPLSGCSKDSRITSNNRVCQEKCVSFFVSFFTSVNLFCYLQIYHHHF